MLKFVGKLWSGTAFKLHKVQRQHSCLLGNVKFLLYWDSLTYVTKSTSFITWPNVPSQIQEGWCSANFRCFSTPKPPVQMAESPPSACQSGLKRFSSEPVLCWTVETSKACRKLAIDDRHCTPLICGVRYDGHGPKATNKTTWTLGFHVTVIDK